MTFEEFLKIKKINAEAFLNQEKEKYLGFKSLFEQIHPESFTAQKKFLINDWRRKYPLEVINE
jgi:hypothetical protein